MGQAACDTVKGESLAVHPLHAFEGRPGHAAECHAVPAVRASRRLHASPSTHFHTFTISNTPCTENAGSTE
jgi:hypothetical protein